MFQFPRFPLSGLYIHPAVTSGLLAGFPHSDITGSMPAHGSPMLFAVYHVLRRLLMPGHPPFAFFRFALSCGDRARPCVMELLRNSTATFHTRPSRQSANAILVICLSNRRSVCY